MYARIKLRKNSVVVLCIDQGGEMFQKTKLNKRYLSAIGMSLVLLLVNTLGILLGTGVGQITPPTTDTWENHIATPIGDASESNPWLINSAENLAYLIHNIADGTYYIELNSDIDLAKHEWEPIKTTNKNVKVYFDGKGHTISNLKINKPWEYGVGLFSTLSYDYDVDLKFENTIFSNVDIRGRSCGVIIDYSAKGEINNCQILSGSIIADSNAGAFACMVWGTFLNCTNNANVFSRVGGVGGIVSHTNGVYACINTGDVCGGGTATDTSSSNGQVGGIAAYCRDMNNCINTGNVTSFGKAVVGGLVGTGCATNSGFYGEINLRSEPKNVGSIVGVSMGTSENCFGVATINFEPDVVADLSVVSKFGGDRDSILNCYSYSKVYTSDKKTQEYRKYKGDNFSGFAYHKNINGGYPFPKTLFAVGQFIDSDVLGYLEDYEFNNLVSPEIKNDGAHYYVELGQYPQEYVGYVFNPTLEDAYTKYITGSDRDILKPAGGYTVGNGTNGTIMYNAYKYTNGKTYVRVPSAIVYGDAYEMYSHVTAVAGETYWFKVEPIKWWVLNYSEVQNGANPIVVSEKALTANVAWNKSTSEGNLWSNKSNMRSWLNSKFYDDAFKGGYKEFIEVTNLKNNTQSNSSDGSGTDTKDNVWLLSYDEVNGKYFSTAADRYCTPTDFALVNNCYMVKVSVSGVYRQNCVYFLRTALVNYPNDVRTVNDQGSLSNAMVNNVVRAVRPAMTLML